ncbi:MAG TPA: GNAT family N-acetyltransferase [Methanomicrobia archaeon]|nr:GNAT family N-acetyltransferase [Methanomicrobia archaeon]
MAFFFYPMNERYAKEIAYEWTYEEPYSFYDLTADEDDLREFFDPETWDRTFAVLDHGWRLVGFFTYGFTPGCMEIGLGLAPWMTGRGEGGMFVRSGIAFGLQHFCYEGSHVCLSVASFNKRAIRTYLSAGFEIERTFMQKTNGDEHEFVRMKKRIRKKR